MSTKITVEHDGKTYEGNVGTIESTFLGTEDHGIVSVMLNFKFEHGGVGVGGYGLDTPENTEDGKTRRVGTAYGLDHIMRIMAIILYAGSAGWGGRSIGIASLTDSDRVLILEDHAQAWKDRVTA